MANKLQKININRISASGYAATGQIIRIGAAGDFIFDFESGDLTTSANAGTGSGILKIGTNVTAKSLLAGSNIQLSGTDNELTIHVTGVTGVSGSSGTSGSSGSTGTSGSSGSTGTSGSSGSSGTSGSSGSPGTSGTSGSTGATGPTGEMGLIPQFIVYETGIQIISGNKTFISGVIIQNSSLSVLNGNVNISGDVGISGAVDSPFLRAQAIKYAIIFG